VRISYTFDNAPYLGGTQLSDYRCSLGFLRLPIIIVVIVVEIKGLRLTIISGDDCIYSHGCQDGCHVVSPFVIVGVSKLRDVAPLSFVEGRFGGSHCEIVEMVLSFSAICAAVAMATRFRVLEALLEIVIEIVRFFDSSASRAHNLLKDELVDLSRRDTKTVYIQSTICVRVCTA
jgi:hypothetical protein